MQSTYLRMWAWVKDLDETTRKTMIKSLTPPKGRDFIIGERGITVNDVDLLEALRNWDESH